MCARALAHTLTVQIVSVCNLLCLLRYIRDGLLHVGVHDMYCRVNSARFRLAAARYGYRLADDEERDEQYLRRLLAEPITDTSSAQNTSSSVGKKTRI